ncbi:progonadoliberin-1 isoform X2 [Meleagris gallopavo]|nr:progonadoliberin-1 isoform X2 [Meleagris gallopavo]
MEKARKISVGVLLFTTSVAICLAQHWSYGLQPGGKRNVENLVESFQEIANEMENLGEAQKAECPGSYQHPSLSNLKETMASLIEGEARRKKI